MRKLVTLGLVSITLGLFACGGDGEGDAIDQALLDQYRAAIPKDEQVMASAPKASVNAIIGEPALYPKGSQDIVQGINGSIGHIVDAMTFIVGLPPTAYNAATQEFVWGPYDNNDGFGKIAAYIKDAGEGAEFRYHYALLRGTGGDVASMTPVIWGGANPDPATKEHGSGVTLWDFEANYTFEKDNNPDFASLALERGRFVAVYGRGPSNGGEATMVVAVLHDFVPRENPENPPTHLDYFYGSFTDGTTKVDFVDWASSFNVDDDPAKPLAEDVAVRLAFVNEGMGRAEAQASGGDLAMGQVADAVECWDNTLSETYLSFTTSTNGMQDGSISDGDPASCGAFKATLDELGVPSLADVDPALKAKLDEVAKNGVPAN